MTDREKEICHQLAELYEQQLPFVKPADADTASASAGWTLRELDAWAKRRAEIQRLEEELYREIESDKPIKD